MYQADTHGSQVNSAHGRRVAFEFDATGKGQQQIGETLFE
jgi:hypothetical protein